MSYSSLRSPRSFFFTLSVAAGLLAGSACGDPGGGTADAGRDGGGGGGDMDAACFIDCAAPPPGCRWEPVVGECSCGTLVCEDAGAPTDDTGTPADDAYVPPGTDAYVPPGTDAGGVGTCTSNAQCGRGQFCMAASCGGVGSCVTTPMACPRIYMPVCGCDGVTYDNDCTANAAGQNVAHTGECATTGGCTSNADCMGRMWCAGTGCGTSGTCEARPDVCPSIFAPVCGCDGNTYGNSCEAAAAGVRTSYDGECGASTGCTSNAECGRGEYCSGTGCDTPGACTARPDICPDLFAPVCGCDGNTYGNSCDAAAAGVRVASEGECASSGPTCTPPCGRGQYCAVCRGSGGPVNVCLPTGSVC